MISSGFCTTPGRNRSFLPQNNRDAAVLRNRGTYRAAALCDGGSGGPGGALAARLTARAAADFLDFRFARCLLEEPQILRRELIQSISRVLTDAARQARASPDQLGCTLLAAALDSRGRACLFHLGDGALLGRLYPGGAWTVLSRPQQGPTPGSTARTMDDAMYRCLRFSRSVRPPWQELALVSDGAIEALGDGLLTCLDRPEELECRLALARPEDDATAVWLTRTP